jgi:hypothetical protein
MFLRDHINKLKKKEMIINKHMNHLHDRLEYKIETMFDCWENIIKNDKYAAFPILH